MAAAKTACGTQAHKHKCTSTHANKHMCTSTEAQVHKLIQLACSQLSANTFRAAHCAQPFEAEKKYFLDSRLEASSLYIHVCLLQYWSYLTYGMLLLRKIAHTTRIKLYLTSNSCKHCTHGFLKRVLNWHQFAAQPGAQSTVCYIGGVHKEEVVNNSGRAFNVFEMYFVFCICHCARRGGGGGGN